MRTGLLGTAVLLAASHLAAAAPQAPQPAPPAALPFVAEAAPIQDPPVGKPEQLPNPPSSGPAPAPQPGQPQGQPAAPAQPQPAAAAQGPPAFRDDHCGPPERWWVGGGPLLFWIKDAGLPLLATAGNGGTLGGDIDYGMFQGVQLDGGFWFDRRHVFGVALGGFLLEQRTTFGGLFSDAAGSPPIARPIIDALTVQPIGVLAATPGAFAGSVEFATSSRLASAEAGLVHNLFYDRDYTVDVGFGFRYLDLDEDLTVLQSTRSLGNGVLNIAGNPVSAVVLEDRFETRNQIYAGQFSTRAEYRMGPVFLNVLSKVALGPNHEVVRIGGLTRDPAGSVAVASGLLAAAGSNAGQQTTSRFVVMPEFGAQVGCQVTRHIRLSAGYQFLYINDVARPAAQIDPAINLRFVPLSRSFGSLSGPTTPQVTVRRDDFFAHGLRFGMEVSY